MNKINYFRQAIKLGNGFISLKYHNMHESKPLKLRNMTKNTKYALKNN
jgi:hypothetical protein